MAALREAAQPVVVGAGTMRAENPPPFLRSQKKPPAATPPAFTWVILTRTFDLPADGRVLSSSEVRKIIVAPGLSDGRTPSGGLEARAEIWRLGREQVDLGALLNRLGERGVRRLVVEGGGEVNFAFFKAGLVDEVFVTVCPYILGGRGAPTLADGEGFAAGGALRLELLDLERRGAEVFLHYRCRRRS